MEEYGIAFTSPGWSSPGLLGTQGWSPDTSFCTEEGLEAFEEDGIDDVRSVQQSSRKSIGVFPLPPVRGLSVKPKIAKAVSSVDLKVMRDLQAWSFDGLANSTDATNTKVDMEMDGEEMDALHLISYRMNRMRPTHIDMPLQHRRRIFSAPAPHSLSGESSDEESSTEDPGEYPFPYMIPFESVQCQRTVSQQDEDIKLQRLQASLSLLSVNGMESEEAGNPLMKGLEIMSPEQSAPSLAEQMAYACGLGNHYGWSSPAKIDLSSPSGLYLPSSVSDASTFAQEERKMASRHVRQVVAASGSAPMPRSVSMQSALAGETAEVGSSWSHKAYGEDDDEAASESDMGCDFDDDEQDKQYWLRTETPMNRSSMSQHSHSASMASMASSPILHGPLSARDFETHSSRDSSSGSGSDSDSPSTSATSSYSSEPSLAVEKAVATSSSPNSLHEFSYILDSDDFAAASSPQFRQSVQDDGFNGCTFSPALQTPDVEDMPPMPIGSGPSPVMEQSSLEPDTHFMKNRLTMLPTSFSTSSVLERPRPVCRGSNLTPFFGKEMVQEMTRSNSTSSVRRVSECPRPTSVAASTINALDRSVEQHQRLPLASSLRASEMYTSKSMSAFVEKDFERGLFHHGAACSSSPSAHNISLESLVAATPKKVVAFSSMNAEYMISARSSFTVGGSSAPRLSNKALAQVRDACRARDNHARNVQLERMHREDQQQQQQQQQRQPHYDTLTAQKKGFFFSTMSRSHASEPALSRIRAPAPALAHPAQQQVKSKLDNDKALPSAPAAAESVKQEEQNRIAPLPRGIHIRRQCCTYSIPDTARVLLPTLLVARTEYQRRRGYTGVPETEPAALALAKMNIRSAIPTRSSTAEGLIHRPHLLEQGGLPNMPHGVVLIVEEKFTHCTRTLA